MLKDILAQLREPDRKYRGIPFWSWNDKLEPEELRCQIREMKKAGLGGYFMHARAGLKTPYMEEEWMKCIEASIDEGYMQNMDSWIYDENGYPSGFAGGKIPAMGLEYQQKFLKFEIVDGPVTAYNTATLGYYRIGGDYERVESDRIKQDEKALHVYWQVNPYYTDLLNEDAVAAFIESTYHVYYKKFGGEFGKGVPGFFTDEPQYGRTAIPWSSIISDRFHNKYGYDLISKLPALYYKTKGFQKVRYDFWNLVKDIFINSVSRQLSQWCEAHGCRLTGHVLLEENIYYQVMCSGSAMGFYRYMHIPGVDWLGRSTGNPVAVKQVSSVAEQLGKDLVLSEMFAAAGWGTSLEELKNIAEWQYSLGVNVICAHLEAYSLKGFRKRDHPPVLFHQTNWWKEYKKFNDYFARLGMLLSSGESTVHVLIIHPLRSGWIAIDESCCSNGKNPEMVHIDDSFARLSEMLSGLHIEYHYGDEDIIAEFGSISDKRCIIGKCRYDTVIIPPCTTVAGNTARLLKGFIECGGKVFAFEDFPYMVDGIESDDLRSLKTSCAILEPGYGNLNAVLENAGCRKISVKGENRREIKDISHKAACYKDGMALFLLNMSDIESYEAEIEIAGEGKCFMVDIENCSISSHQSQQMRDTVRFNLKFNPGQSYMVVLSDKLQSKEGAKCSLPEYKAFLSLQEKWRIKQCSPNVMVLDYCQLSIEDGPWSENKPVIRTQMELLELGRNADISMEFKVESTYDFKDKEVFLVIEDSDRYRIEINGKPVLNKPVGWWKDKCLHKIDILGQLRKGINSIILRTSFCNSSEILKKLERAKVFEAEANMLSFDSEVDNIYLLGEFEVACKNELVPIERNAFKTKGGFLLNAVTKFESGGEMTTNGYPFFSGNIILEQEIEIPGVERYGSILFRMERPYAALTKLYVNGKEAKTFLWGPYEAEILPFTLEGKNSIAIELVSTDRNLFGPHHNPDGELYSVGPLSFSDSMGWTDDYSLICFGIHGKPELICSEKE